MTYTYTPGTRPDALAILRDKGLLDTPPRIDPKPGTFILDASGHYRIGEDGKAHPVPSKHRPPANDGPQVPEQPFSVLLSKAVLFGLLPICFLAWLVAGKTL